MCHASRCMQAPSTVVALAIRATGPDPYRDALIDVGAAVAVDGAVARVFGELMRPDGDHFEGGAFPERVRRRTGITAAMLERARPRNAVMGDLLDFLPREAFFVAHDPAVAPFLRTASGDRFLAPVLDTMELARICLPDRPSHELPDLLTALGRPRPEARLSLDDCEAVLLLWSELRRRMAAWPAPLIEHARALLSPLRHPLRDLLEAAPAAAGAGQGRGAVGDGGREESFGKPRRTLPDPDARVPLDADEAAAVLAPDGPVAACLPGYESREQQIDMTRAVAAAFNDRRHLLVEAGTGIGKSLAYLVPAVLWAQANGMPVVISTNTKNLQSQLFRKDLPLVARALDASFTTAIIKGRRNYLCPRKLEHLLRYAAQELEDRERVLLLRVLAWVHATRVGDMSDCPVLDAPAMRALRARLSSSAEECPGPACARRGACFLHRARRRSLAADVVVANHALVFSEMELEEAGTALPAHAQIVFDEAHNIEEAATSWLSVELSTTRLHFVLSRLSRKGRRRAGGLIGALLQALRDADLADSGPGRTVRARADEVLEALDATQAPATAFFAALAEEILAPAGKSSVRLRSAPAPESRTAACRARLLAALAALARAIEVLTAALRDIEDDALDGRDDAMQDLTGTLTALREFVNDVDFVLRADAEGYVFWVERAPARRGGARAWGAPVDVGQRLAAQLYTRRDSIVLCSATLTVRQSFDYIKRRLGLDRFPPERVSELAVGTPFDYPRQCAVLVPVFLAEPDRSGAAYAEALGRLLANVFRRTQGRGMALFTSYDMLRRTGEVLEPALRDDAILVLSQGQSGSRESITEIFRQDLASVLMGTHSFWEGVDVAGETLSCLVMARLPFAVFTDPIVEARCEEIEARGENAFVTYSLPSAVIRFRQGFGRLIRHRTDRGIVIVADRRILTRRYGDWFRRSIPARTAAVRDENELLEQVERFFAAE